MPDDLTQLNVLVVDTDQSMRVLTRDILHTIGVTRIDTINNTDRAVAELRANSFDLLITERDMAPLNGIELTRMIRNSPDSPNTEVPILMVTVMPTMKMVTEARDAGVNEFLIKPYSVKNLHARISAIIDQPRTFVRVSDYFGPDRRRVSNEVFGEDRRG